MSKEAVLTVYYDAYDKIELPEHYDPTCPAARPREYGESECGAFREQHRRSGAEVDSRAGWRFCWGRDPRAKRFSLFGALWFCLPGETPDARLRQWRAISLVWKVGMQARGLDPGPGRDRLNWHFNDLDAWAGQHPGHDAALAALDAVIDYLENDV